MIFEFRFLLLVCATAVVIAWHVFPALTGWWI